jgi:hypothetical protein
MDTDAEDNALVAAYLKHYLTRADSVLWAFNEVSEITLKDAERGWTTIQALIAAAPDEGALAYVAAGPLDEVLEAHGRQIIDRVEELARQSPRFRRPLSRVACFEDSMPEEIRTRVGKAVGRA